MTDEPGLIMNEQKSNALLARGAWTVAHVERLEHLCAVSPKRQGPIDLSGVTALDTVGAWLFEKLARAAQPELPSPCLSVLPRRTQVCFAKSMS